MSEPHVSYISRACSSLVRQPYYAPNCIISKIRDLETILASAKGRLDGRTFYIDEYTLIFLFSRCIRCAQKRDCWESVRFASGPGGIPAGRRHNQSPSEALVMPPKVPRPSPTTLHASPCPKRSPICNIFHFLNMQTGSPVIP